MNDNFTVPYNSNVFENETEDFSIVEEEEENQFGEIISAEEIEREKQLEENIDDIEPNEDTDDIDLDVDNDTFTGKIADVAGDIGKSVTSGEIFRAIPAGAERAINQTAKFLSDTANYVEDKLGIGEEGKLTFGQGALDYISNMDFISDEFETVTGSMAASVSQFATGMFLTRGLASAKTASTARKIANTAMRGAIADAVVFDPQEDNLSKMMKDNEWSIPVITEFLATDQNDNEFKNRLRNAGEGVIAGGLLDSMYHGIKAVKLSRKAREEIGKNGSVSKSTQGKLIQNEIDEVNNLNSNKTRVLSNAEVITSKEKLDKTKKLDINAAKENTAIEVEGAMLQAKAVAESKAPRVKAIKRKLIEEFEESVGVKKGSFTTGGKFDFEKTTKVRETVANKARSRLTQTEVDARNEEIDKANALIVERNRVRKQASKNPKLEELIPKVSAIDAQDFSLLDDDMFTPFLNAETFNKVIALAADLAEKNKELFKRDQSMRLVTDAKGKEKLIPSGKKETVIEKIMDVAISKDLDVTNHFNETLKKYNMSGDELVLLVVGQGSEYGRGLRQIRTIMDRINPKDLKAHRQAQDALEQEGKFRNFIMRLENVRRGGMVSSIATAARNFQSAGIRAPLEGLGNVMDTAIKDLQEGGIGAGAKSLVSGANWSGSFNHMRYIFRNPRSIKLFSDFLFQQKGMDKFEDKLFGQINEIRRYTGSGTGGALDKTFTKIEGVVDFLNTPNRIQEFTVRRGVMFGELERLLKREWGVDLFDEITNGNINKIMNNNLRPNKKNVPSFAELMDESTRKALDITYAKQPDTKLFKDLTRIITENGLTVIIPFPRFMFNSIELMAQYGAGASIPITKKLTSLMRKNVPEGGVITARDRELISRNIIGMSMAMAAYQWRTTERAPENYKLIDDRRGTETTEDDFSLDVTPQFPLRQYLFIGESIKRLKEGTFDQWFDAKDFTETFAGTNVRVGTGHAIIDEIADAVAADSDLVGEERRAKAAGRFLGQYLSSWAIPFAQILDTQRAIGGRPMEYRDMAPDPTLSAMDTFIANVKRPFLQRGFGISGEDEAKMPVREFLFQEGPTKERGPMLGRVLLGANMMEKDSVEGQYLAGKGYTEFGLGSKSSVPSIRNYENKSVRAILPAVVDFAKMKEKELEEEYKNEPQIVRDTETIKGYIDKRVKPYIETLIREYKTELAEGKYLNSSNPRYLAAQNDYRNKLSKNQKAFALQKFKSIYERLPQISGSEEGVADLEALIALGEEFKF